MRIFVIHKGEDFEEVMKLKTELTKEISADILILESDKKFKTWKSEAKYKIRLCDLVLYVLGKHTSESKNVDFEIKYARKKHRQILVYKLDDKEDYKISDSLYVKDKFTGKPKPLFKIIKIKDLEKVLQFGYEFDIKDKLDAIGGVNAVQNIADCVNNKNYDSYLDDLLKSNIILDMHKFGFNLLDPNFFSLTYVNGLYLEYVS